MIVTCPACSARYKINEAKIQGRGAKITCPRCGHRFVVYREERPPSDIPESVGTVDFSTVGLSWRVRRGSKIVYQFYELSALQDYLLDGLIDTRDQISYDGRDWKRIDEIDHIEAHFWNVFQRARRGEISPSAIDEDEDEEEDESDAPTTIVGRGSTIVGEKREDPGDLYEEPITSLHADLRRSMASPEGDDAAVLLDTTEPDFDEEADDDDSASMPADALVSANTAGGTPDRSASPEVRTRISRPPPNEAGPGPSSARRVRDAWGGPESRAPRSILGASAGQAAESPVPPPPPQVKPQNRPIPTTRNMLPLAALGFLAVLAVGLGVILALVATGIIGGGPTIAPLPEPAHEIPLPRPVPVELEPLPVAPPPEPKPKAKAKRPVPVAPAPAEPVPSELVPVPSDPVPAPAPAEPVPAAPVPAAPVPAPTEPAPVAPVPAAPVPAPAPAPTDAPPPAPQTPVWATPTPTPTPAPEPAPAPAVPATPPPGGG